MSDTPNPGSKEALAQGCTCAAIDNHYGNGIPYPSGPAFWITAGCPIHDPERTESDG